MQLLVHLVAKFGTLQVAIFGTLYLSVYTLFSVNASESGKTASEEDSGQYNAGAVDEASSHAEDGGEPEDMSDAFGGYPYENPAQ